MHHAYLGPILVTVLYIGVYYALQIYQLAVKTKLAREYKARGERFDRYFNTDRVMLATDRYVGNMLEHMPPFLALLWLNAVFVGARDTTIAGAVYLATRLAYPFLMGRHLGRGVPTRIFYGTFTGYGVITYFCLRLLMVALS